MYYIVQYILYTVDLEYLKTWGFKKKMIMNFI